MKNNRPRPDSDGVRRLHSRLVKDWTPRLKTDKFFRDLVRGTNKIEDITKKKGRNIVPREIHSGRAGGIIEHANGLLMAPPSFRVKPKNQETESLREAESLEDLAASFFESQMLANGFWEAIGRDMLVSGRAYLKFLSSASEWIAQAGYPVRKDDESASKYNKRVAEFKDDDDNLPFIITQIPSSNILCMLDANDSVVASIEQKWIPAYILADELGSEEVKKLVEGNNYDWYDELSVIEYMDSKWVGYFLAGKDTRDPSNEHRPWDRGPAYEELKVWEHGLGVHPVVMIPGIDTGDEEYTERWKSFLADARDSLELYDFLLSRLTTMVYAYYLPSYVWTISTKSAAFTGKARPTQEVILGGTTIMFQDEKIEPLGIPDNLPPADRLLKEADDMIQRHTLEDVLFGRVIGSAPAYQVNLRINVAKSKLTPLSAHLAKGITKTIERLFRGIEVLGESVTIAGISVSNTMAKEYRKRITASILPKSPIDRSSDLGTARDALDFGLPWDWIVVNILDISNPATLRLMNDIRNLEESEEVKARLLKDSMDRLEMLIEEEDFQDIEGVNREDLSSDFAAALDQMRAEGPQGGIVPTEDQLAAIGAGGVPPEGVVIDDRSGKPPGAADQTRNPRGLTTENAQPQPGGVQAGSEGAGGRIV